MLVREIVNYSVLKCTRMKLINDLPLVHTQTHTFVTVLHIVNAA